MKRFFEFINTPIEDLLRGVSLETTLKIALVGMILTLVFLVLVLLSPAPAGTFGGVS